MTTCRPSSDTSLAGIARGLGLEIVKELAKNKDNRVIMAIRDISRGMVIAQKIGSNVKAVQLDLSRLSNIKAFINQWDLKIDGLINNAGVQFVSKTNFTPDGLEETIAVNHIAAFMLTIGLLPYLDKGRILFIGSGTHNPYYPYGKIFGFMGAQYTSMEKLVRGEANSNNTKQMNLDRYATSKLLNTITAVELSRRFNNISSFALDPGLMPGTGLARHQIKSIQFIWDNVMPVMRFFWPDTSSTKRSGKVAAWIMTSPSVENKSGSIFSFNKKPSVHVWKDVVLDDKIGKEVFEDTMKIIEDYL